MKRPSIPEVPKPGGKRVGFDAAVKENLEILSGVRPGKIKRLLSSATSDDVVDKINEIIDRLQQ